MTQKSESVREAEQRPTNDQLMNMAEHLTQSSSKVLYSYLVDVRYVSSEWGAKSVTLKLAEEAQQKAGEIQNYQEWTWSNVAAWLREKARQ